MRQKFGHLLFVLLIPCLLLSQEDRQKVGVVLSGGGAKGAAHIGVLRYIEEMGIPVDYVVGTSMGAIMGGMYSLGYSAVELESIIGDLDWDLYMKDEIGVGQMSTDGRMDHNRFLLDIPFDISNGKLQGTFLGGLDMKSDKTSFLTDLPSGFVGGYNLVNLFNSLSVGYGDSIDFYRLPIPFSCVATNVLNGEEVVLKSGLFTSAIRASMAIPGVFSPVLVDGRLLMDGGMSNNFPVDLCKQMGADIIIGVDVGSQLASDIGDLQSLPQLMMQLINLMVSERTAENKRLCTVYIRPNVLGYNMLSFSKQAIDTLISRGYKEAKCHEQQLRLVKDLTNPNGGDVRAFDARRARRISTDTIYLSAIEFNGINSSEEISWLLRKGNIKTHTPITGVDIEKSVELFVGTGNYSRVNYNLLPHHPFGFGRNGEVFATDDNLYELQLSFEYAPPHSCAMGFRYDSEESAMIILRLGLNQNRLSGWKAGTEFRLGYNPRFNAALSWGKHSLANFNAEYDYRQCKYDIGSLNEGLPGKYESVRTHRHNFSLYVSQFHMRNLSLAGGMEYEKYDFSYPSDRYTLFYDVSAILSQFNCAGLFLDMKYDTRNELYMPRTGVLLAMDAHWRKDFTKDRYLEDGRNKNGFADVNMMVSYHYSPDIGLPLTFIPQLYNRFVAGNFKPSVYQNVVGGSLPGRYMDHQVPFIGITTPQMAKNCLSILRMDVQWNVAGNHYLTMMGNYMCSADNYHGYFSGSDSRISRFGLGVQYAYKTAFGPISVDVHWSDIQRKLGMYFAFGYTF